MAPFTYKGNTNRTGFIESFRPWKWSHVRIFWNRITGVVGDRMMWLSGDGAGGPLDHYCHPSILTMWTEFVFQEVTVLPVDRHRKEWYPHRVRLVLMTRMQYLFRGVRYSKWILNRSSYFLRLWPLKRRQSND